jgi:hypothetical protein
VAVLVQPLLSPPWSDVVLFPLASLRLRQPATCARGSGMRQASLPQTPCSPCRPRHTAHPLRHALLAPGERRGGPPRLKSGPRRAPWLLSRWPLPHRLAARPAGVLATDGRCEGSAVRQAPRLDNPPQGTEPLTRQGDHPSPAPAATAVAKALLRPRRQRALGLKAPPSPGPLNGPRADVRVACFGTAPLIGGVATRLRGGRQPAPGSDCFSITQGPPAAERPHNPPGTIDPHPLAPQELRHLLRHGSRGPLEPRAAFSGSRGAESHPTDGGAPTAAGRPRWGASPILTCESRLQSSTHMISSHGSYLCVV